MSELDGAEVAVVAELSGGPVQRRRRHTIRLLAAMLLVVAVGLAVVLARGLGPARSVDSPLLGKAAPRIRLPSIDGDATIDVTHFRGDIVVVNFWASWCVPCREEAPILESFARKWDGQGVRVVGIVYADTLGAARDFRDEFDLTYPQVSDPEGQTSLDFGVTGVPETFVLDPGGVVVAKLVGAVGPSTLDDVLAEIEAGRTVEQHNGDQQPAPSGG